MKSKLSVLSFLFTLSLATITYSGGEQITTYSSIDLKAVKKVSLYYEVITDLNIPEAQLKATKFKNIQRITQMLKARGIQVVKNAPFTLAIETYATAVAKSINYQTTNPETTYHTGSAQAYGTGGYATGTYTGTTTTYKKENKVVDYDQIVTYSKSKIFQGKGEVAVTETPQSNRFAWDSVESVVKEETKKVIENYFGVINDEKILE